MGQLDLQQAVEAALAGLGYELVELERSGRGLLRVTIDFPWAASAEDQGYIGIDDCERATRQLQYLFEVEDVDYDRLEVSSPGIDRPLRKAEDFRRFEGEQVDIVLKGVPLEDTVPGQRPERRKYRGRLECADVEQGQWALLWQEPAPRRGKGGRKHGPATAGAGAAPEQRLDFRLDELESARLAPLVDFKRRRTREPQAEGA